MPCPDLRLRDGRAANIAFDPDSAEVAKQIKRLHVPLHDEATGEEPPLIHVFGDSDPQCEQRITPFTGASTQSFGQSEGDAQTGIPATVVQAARPLAVNNLAISVQGDSEHLGTADIDTNCHVAVSHRPRPRGSREHWR